MPLLPGLVKSLFELEDNPLRFERVCIDLLREVDQIDLVPTSRTWDLGRDGRSAKLDGQSTGAFLLATLTKEVDEKLEADISRLLTRVAPTDVYFCSSRELTEYACEALKGEIRKRIPGAQTVQVLGQVQLRYLGEKAAGEPIIRANYLAEIKLTEDALRSESSLADDPKHIGLRLALITHTGDDARELRQALAKRLVLEALSKKASSTLAEVAHSLTTNLHLPRQMSHVFLASVVESLAAEGFVTGSATDFTLTEAGHTEAATVPEEASGRLLEGREAILDALERLSGRIFTSLDAERTWLTLQDGLADLFYSQGINIVRMIDSLLQGTLAEESPKSLLKGVSEKVGALFGGDQALEIAQAVLDIFTDKSTVAFTWLSQVCSVYVMMCSLGLESVSSNEIATVISRLHLVADSDMVLSLLCQNEDNHEDVRKLVESWRQLGGRLYAALPVLEEVAYHAWIANGEYNRLGRDLYTIDTSLIENAFVRTFARFLQTKVRTGSWQSYIGEYRGARPRDYTNIAAILMDEYGFRNLAPAGLEYADFASGVSSFLCGIAAEEIGCREDDLDRRLKDKCVRDALLLAAVAAARAAAREAYHHSSVIVVSSARRMKAADVHFRHDLGQPEAVLSSAALGCLLSLLPGVSMNLTSLRHLLFDLELSKKLTSLQQFAFRVIERSDQYDLPRARRVTLERELRRELLADAALRGEPARHSIARFMTGKAPEYTADVIARTLDQMAIHSKGQDELRKRVSDLEQRSNSTRR